MNDNDLKKMAQDLAYIKNILQGFVKAATPPHGKTLADDFKEILYVGAGIIIFFILSFLVVALIDFIWG